MARRCCHKVRKRPLHYLFVIYLKCLSANFLMESPKLRSFFKEKNELSVKFVKEIEQLNIFIWRFSSPFLNLRQNYKSLFKLQLMLSNRQANVRGFSRNCKWLRFSKINVHTESWLLREPQLHTMFRIILVGLYYLKQTFWDFYFLFELC